jgi:5-deoxy-glucuronate isomerase
MAAILRAADNGNRPLVDVRDPTLSLTCFNLLKLKAGERHAFKLPKHECVIAPMSGVADVTVAGEAFDAPGGRSDVWSGVADSFYAPVAAGVSILVGRTKRGLVQHFHPAHGAIVARSPGIQAMRDKFK